MFYKSLFYSSWQTMSFWVQNPALLLLAIWSENSLSLRHDLLNNKILGAFVLEHVGREVGQWLHTFKSSKLEVSDDTGQLCATAEAFLRWLHNGIKLSKLLKAGIIKIIFVPT